MALVGIAFLVALAVYLLYEFVLSGDDRSVGAGSSSARFYGSGPQEAGVQPIALTHDAWELRRVRGEHLQLIASIPETPGPTPVLSMEQRQESALARIIRYPDGVPPPRGVDEGWFDIEEGLTFYRASGGDWTPRRVRESHSHRNLFYHTDYPGEVLNFADGSIHRVLARELAFEAVGVMPVLEEPSPSMIRAFESALGWELRGSPGPSVNVWTTFRLSQDSGVHTFAVGGVMRMGVRSEGQGEDMFQYLVPGEWVGSVVVERMG